MNRKLVIRKMYEQTEIVAYAPKTTAPKKWGDDA